MQFKDLKARTGYCKGVRAEMPDGSVKIIRLWPEMRDITLMLDCMAMMWVKTDRNQEPKEITVTASIEPRKKPSLHPYGGAVDYRTRDWNGQFRKAVEQYLILLRLQLNSDYHFQFESDHLHIQYKRLADAERAGLPFVRYEKEKA